MIPVHVAVDADEVFEMITRGTQMRGLQRGMAAVGAHILSRLATYPPQDPSSTYRRTGTLGRRWTMQGTRGGLVITIGNNTPYAPRVQGPEQTAYFKRVGWKNPGDVVAAETGAIQRLLNAYVEADL